MCWSGEKHKNTKTQETRRGFAVSKFESFVRKNTKTHRTHWLSVLGPGKNTKTRRTHGALFLAKLKIDKKTQKHIAHMAIVIRYHTQSYTIHHHTYKIYALIIWS